ncbi:MAG: hypothetical protein QM820_40770 [Minicystis sp.]
MSTMLSWFWVMGPAIDVAAKTRFPTTKSPWGAAFENWMPVAAA